MISKADLEIQIQEAGFTSFDVETDMFGKSDVKLANLADLFSLAKLNEIKTLFFCYTYATPELLVIDDNVLSRLRLHTSAAREVLDKRIEEHNERVREMDYNRPITLHVFCLMGGYKLYFDEVDFWFVEEGVNFPETQASLFAVEALDEIEEKAVIQQRKYEEKKEELRHTMLNDEKFHICTNQYLRRDYTYKMFGNDMELQDLFFEHRDTIERFVEIVWKEYRMLKQKRSRS